MMGSEGRGHYVILIGWWCNRLTTFGRHDRGTALLRHGRDTVVLVIGLLHRYADVLEMKLGYIYKLLGLRTMG